MNPTTPRAYGITGRPRDAWTPDAFRARALELMEMHHAAWWACQSLESGLDDAQRLAWIDVAVPSATVAGAVYRVRYDAA
jgi:hypothetical protein